MEKNQKEENEKFFKKNEENDADENEHESEYEYGSDNSGGKN